MCIEFVGVRKSEVACEMRNPNEVEIGLNVVYYRMYGKLKRYNPILNSLSK